MRLLLYPTTHRSSGSTSSSTTNKIATKVALALTPSSTSLLSTDLPPPARTGHSAVLNDVANGSDLTINRVENKDSSLMTCSSRSSTPTTSTAQEEAAMKKMAWGQQCSPNCGCVVRFEAKWESLRAVNTTTSTTTYRQQSPVRIQYMAKQVQTTRPSAPTRAIIHQSQMDDSNTETVAMPILTTKGRPMFLPCTCTSLHTLASALISHYDNNPFYTWNTLQAEVEFQSTRSTPSFVHAVLVAQGLIQQQQQRQYPTTSTTRRGVTTYPSHCFDLVEEAWTAMLRGYMPQPRRQQQRATYDRVHHPLCFPQSDDHGHDIPALLGTRTSTSSGLTNDDHSSSFQTSLDSTDDGKRNSFFNDEYSGFPYDFMQQHNNDESSIIHEQQQQNTRDFFTLSSSLRSDATIQGDSRQSRRTFVLRGAVPGITLTQLVDEEQFQWQEKQRTRDPMSTAIRGGRRRKKKQPSNQSWIIPSLSTMIPDWLSYVDFLQQQQEQETG